MKFLTIVFLTLISVNLWASAPSAPPYTGDHKSLGLALPATAAGVRQKPLLIRTPQVLFTEARAEAILAALQCNDFGFPKVLTQLIAAYVPFSITIPMDVPVTDLSADSNGLVTAGPGYVAVHDLVTGQPLARANTEGTKAPSFHMLWVEGSVFLVDIRPFGDDLLILKVVYEKARTVAGKNEQARVALEKIRFTITLPRVASKEYSQAQSITKIHSCRASGSRLFLDVQVRKERNYGSNSKQTSKERRFLFMPFMDMFLELPYYQPYPLEQGDQYYPINDQEILITAAHGTAFMVLKVDLNGEERYKTFSPTEYYTCKNLGFDQSVVVIDAAVRADVIYALVRREDGISELVRFLRGMPLESDSSEDEDSEASTATALFARDLSNPYSAQRLVLGYQPVKIFLQGERLVVIDSLGVVHSYTPDLTFEREIEIGMARKFVLSLGGILCSLVGEVAKPSVTCIDVSE